MECEFNRCKEKLVKILESKPVKFSIWSPRGQLLWAAAKIQKDRGVKLWVFHTVTNGVAGFGKEIVERRIENVLAAMPDPWGVNHARWWSAQYNIGYGFLGSMQATYDDKPTKGLLPIDFGPAWNLMNETGNTKVRIPTGMKDGKTIYAYRDYSAKWEITRCYVWQVAGLCGDKAPAESYFGQYEASFTPKTVGNRVQWVLK